MHKLRTIQLLIFLGLLILGINSCVDYKGNDVVPVNFRSIEASNMDLNISADSSFVVNLGSMVNASESFTVQIKPFEAGSFELLNDSTLKYIPKEGFVGTDSTTVTACLVGTPSNCATATIRFKVSPKRVECRGRAFPDTINFGYGEQKIVNLALNDSFCVGKNYHIRLDEYVTEYCNWSNGSATAFIFQASPNLPSNRELVVPYGLYENNELVDSSFVVLRLTGRVQHCAQLYNLVGDEVRLPRQRVFQLHINSVLANDMACPNDLVRNRFHLNPMSENRTYRTEMYGDSLYFYPIIGQGAVPVIDTVYYSIPSASAGLTPNRLKRAPIIIKYN